MILVLINVFLIGTNYQCIAHNFIHNPFFKSQSLNGLFSILNTLCLGMPASMYRAHHLNHHRYNNHPEKDDSSTFRHGKNGEQENIFTYCLLGILRTNLPALYRVAKKQSSLVVAELLVMIFFIATLLFLNGKLVIYYLIPSYLFGQFFALLENYCEHNHTNFNDRKRDSVSCYNSIYNFIWFNNGFHQEHHYSPQVHWTKISSVKDTLPSDRTIIGGCHLMNSLKKYKK